MFKKKKCRNCGEKINKSDRFCPNCGNPLYEKYNRDEADEGDWGMLGKDDFIPEIADSEIRLPFGFNALFNSLMKNLGKEFDKQFREIDKELGKQKNKKTLEKPSKQFRQAGGISINISSLGGGPPEIKVRSFGNVPEFKQREEKIKKQIKKIKPTGFSEKSMKKLSALPKVEPSTNIRRLSNKVIYEIDMPGVKSTKDVSIIQLENSIEIKALGKDKAYFKLIPINLPIIDYKLQKGKLILELES